MDEYIFLYNDIRYKYLCTHVKWSRKLSDQSKKLNCSKCFRKILQYRVQSKQVYAFSSCYMRTYRATDGAILIGAQTRCERARKRTIRVITSTQVAKVKQKRFRFV
jgi:hypothetical protein